MAQSVPNPPPGFDALSVDEKIEYVGSLWDQIVAHSEIAVPDWHLALIRERLDAFRVEAASGRTWSEARTELRRKYGLPRNP
jgi:hypothetical protein